MISVIIPAHNEEKYIGETLDSIRCLNFKDLEIIVVCDSCRDKTYERAVKKSDKTFKVNFKCAPAARNFGASKSKGETLIFLDADTSIVSRNYFDIINKYLEKNKSSKNRFVATSFFIPDNKKLKFLLFCFAKNLASLFGMANGVIIIDAKTFNDLNGFNEKIFPVENGDLIKRARKIGRFKMFNLFVMTSMRRHDSVGLINGIKFWLGEMFNKNKNEYGAVR